MPSRQNISRAVMGMKWQAEKLESPFGEVVAQWPSKLSQAATFG